MRLLPFACAYASLQNSEERWLLDAEDFVDDGDDVGDGILNAPADDEQARTAGYADHGHDEAFLIAEDVAERHLPGERQPPPDGADAFEQDSLAHLGRLGLQQACGPFAQRGRD